MASNNNSNKQSENGSVRRNIAYLSLCSDSYKNPLDDSLKAEASSNNKPTRTYLYRHSESDPAVRSSLKSQQSNSAVKKTTSSVDCEKTAPEGQADRALYRQASILVELPVQHSNNNKIMQFYKPHKSTNVNNKMISLNQRIQQQAGLPVIAGDKAAAVAAAPVSWNASGRMKTGCFDPSIPPSVSKGPHVHQAICKVKDPGGLDCYGFLFALPVTNAYDVRYGLITLSGLGLGQRYGNSLMLLVHFEASFRVPKPIEIPFRRWISSRKYGITFFQLPKDAADYVKFKRLEFLDLYPNRLAEGQKVLALRNKQGSKIPQSIVGDIAHLGSDGYFKHKISSFAGLPLLDPSTSTVIGLQKGADLSGNELAIVLRSAVNDMAPEKSDNWIDVADDSSTANKLETNTSDNNVGNLNLIKQSKLIPDLLKNTICDAITKLQLTAEELALRSDADIRLIFPRRDIQEAVYCWKRSIQIDCWRREQLPLAAGRLHSAVKAGDINKVKAILHDKSIPPGCRPLLVEHRDANNFNNTILHQAVLRGYIGIVQLLLREFNANAFTRDGHELESMAIHLAAAHGHLDIVSLLLDYRPELIEAKNRSSDTALNRAAARGRLMVCQFLVDRKLAKVDNRGEYGRTPLMMAAAWGQLPVVEYLVSRGADAYAKDSETASTALHLAAYFGNANVAGFLVGRHPDLALYKNRFGKTAWARAKENQKKNVIMALASKGISES